MTRRVSVHPAGAGSSPTLQTAGSGPCPDSYLMPAPGDLDRIRAATLCLINEERESHGVRPLKENGHLEQAAQGHTEDMLGKDYFEHIAPSGSTPLDRIKASGYIYSSRLGYAIGENIAWGSLRLATPEAIVNAWINSAGHLANILNPHFQDTAIGVVANVPDGLAQGHAGATYTQDFGAISTG